MDRPDRENQSGFQPFVSVATDLPELTFKAVALGAVMAIILGAANAYLGMRAGSRSTPSHVRPADAQVSSD